MEIMQRKKEWFAIYNYCEMFWIDNMWEKI